MHANTLHCFAFPLRLNIIVGKCPRFRQHNRKDKGAGFDRFTPEGSHITKVSGFFLLMQEYFGMRREGMKELPGDVG